MNRAGSGISRRKALQTMGAAGATALFAPAIARADITGPIRIGALLPMTGAGGIWGPVMADVQQKVVKQVNDAGGINGQRVEYYFEDDQTNPDAGVLAARKLIEVNKVCAIMGVWSSAVAFPTLPMCWESKVVMLGIAASDGLAKLPHMGYFIRTNVPIALQGQAIGRFGIEKGCKNFFMMLAQNPFSPPMRDALIAEVEPKGAKTGSVLYDGNKMSFRSEVDQALKSNPDFIMLGGYPQDSAAIMKDLYRNGYTGKVCGIGTAITSQFVQAAGKQVAEGVYTVQPAPAATSAAYKNLQQITGKEQLDTNSCQAFDQVNLVLLEGAAAKEASGEAIQKTIRSTIGGPDGEVVGTVLDGLKLLKDGKKINYDGASSACEFLPNGDIVRANFETRQVKDGAIVLV